jgi:S-adenosylmethionine-dependent methyltransferase
MMRQNASERFDAHAKEWAQYYREPLGRIRHQVIWSNLAPHLPDPDASQEPSCVLDVGGGSGELALQLVQRGYRVSLLDFAPGMLEQSRQSAQALPETIRARLDCHLGSAEDAPSIFPPDSFDAIASHTLVDYLPEPQDTLGLLLPLLREGGLFSITCANHHAELLRQVWTHGDPVGALDNLQGRFWRSGMFQVPGQAFAAEEMEAWLLDLGLTITARCGVRCFADFVDRTRLDEPSFFDALLRLEKAVSTLTPYSLISRYVHLIAHKPVGSRC